MITTVFALCLLAAPVEATPDETAVRESAQRIAETMSAGDASVFNSLFDVNSFFGLMMKDVGASSSYEQRTREEHLKKLRELGTSVLKDLGEGASYRLMRVHSVNQHPHAIFRTLTKSGGLDYYDLEFRVLYGSPRFVDVMVYSKGESLSDTMRRSYVSKVIVAEPGLLEPLSPKEREQLKSLSGVIKVQQQLAAKQYHDVLTTYNSLPAELRSRRPVLVARVKAAAQISEAMCLKVIAEAEKALPEDAVLALTLMEGFSTFKKWDMLPRAFDRVERFVGADAHISVLRSNAFMEQKKVEEACKALRDAIRREPSMQASYFVLLKTFMKLERYEEVGSLLIEMEKKIGFDPSVVETGIEYTGFRRSEFYAAWRNAHK